MTRNALIRLSYAGLIGGLAGLSVLAVLGFLNAQGITGCSVTGGWGVLVPIVMGWFVGGAAWGFFSAREDENASPANSRRQCPECGGTILGDWRLCPHCGSRLTNAASE